MSISGGLGAVPSDCWAALEERMRQWGRLTFDIVNPRQADDPLNSSKDNRYLTVFFASRPDGDLNILAEAQSKSPLVVQLKNCRNGYGTVEQTLFAATGSDHSTTKFFKRFSAERVFPGALEHHFPPRESVPGSNAPPIHSR
jgi:hypothetical protein